MTHGLQELFVYFCSTLHHKIFSFVWCFQFGPANWHPVDVTISIVFSENVHDLTVSPKLWLINHSPPLLWSQIIQNGRYNIITYIYVNNKQGIFSISNNGGYENIDGKKLNCWFRKKEKSWMKKILIWEYLLHYF